MKKRINRFLKQLAKGTIFENGNPWRKKYYIGGFYKRLMFIQKARNVQRMEAKKQLYGS